MARIQNTTAIRRTLEWIATTTDAPRLDRPRFHPFPARMPIWLAEGVIKKLSQPGDSVLDPMVGSGTTAIAALRTGRAVVGIDLDPMALLLTRVATTPFDTARATKTLAAIRIRAEAQLKRSTMRVEVVRRSFEDEDQSFLKYWFPPRSQKALFALATEIASLPAGKYRDLAWAVFSSLIIAKSSGVSYALDIARSRPHRRIEKPILDPMHGWSLRAKTTIDRLPFRDTRSDTLIATIRRGDARKLKLTAGSIDLVVTSPPYLNAVDYMRAHKFSLVWMGHTLDQLRAVRGRMIGSERGMYSPDSLPPRLEQSIVENIPENPRLGIVRRYLSDMRRVLLETRRVLKPGGAVVMALGPSVMSAAAPDAGEIVGSLAESVGLVNVGSIFRQLEESRRSLPPPLVVSRDNPLRLRMAGEIFLGLCKP